jgi:hypothetical protein
MYNPDTDLLFPPRALPALRDIRGSAWQELVNNVIMAGPGSLDQITFILMMARMNNCTTCNFAAYRAINGCTVCAKQSIKRFREDDNALICLFQGTKTEVEYFLNHKESDSSLKTGI